jgi:hypothetical protein
MKLHYNRKIFISHADEDTEIAHAIAFNLKRRLNLEVALDKYFLTIGENWRTKIETEIRSSEIMIVLKSRIVAHSLAKGVDDEIQIAERYRVPVVVGLIRQQIDFITNSVYQTIDFGKDGKNEDAIFEIAKLLLEISHPFAISGLAAIATNKQEASKIIGNTEFISNNAEKVIVIGHTLKSWLQDYGNLIRYGKAQVKVYFPSMKDLSLKYLTLIHKNGERIIDEIRDAKKRAIELNFEKGLDKDKFECYVLKIKPMFSMMAVDIHLPNGFITIDNYLFKVSSENRPKIIVFKQGSDLFEQYKKILFELLQDAQPLESQDQ